MSSDSGTSVTGSSGSIWRRSTSIPGRCPDDTDDEHIGAADAAADAGHLAIAGVKPDRSAWREQARRCRCARNTEVSRTRRGSTTYRAACGPSACVNLNWMKGRTGLFHAQRSLFGAREELAYERIRGRSRRVGDRLTKRSSSSTGRRDTPRSCRCDVVGDHDVGTAVLGGPWISSAEDGRADRIEPPSRVRRTSRPGLRTSSGRTPAAASRRQLGRRLVQPPDRPTSPWSPMDDLGDSTLVQIVFGAAGSDVVATFIELEQRPVLEQDPSACASPAARTSALAPIHCAP